MQRRQTQQLKDETMSAEHKVDAKLPSQTDTGGMSLVLQPHQPIDEQLDTQPLAGQPANTSIQLDFRHIKSINSIGLSAIIRFSAGAREAGQLIHVVHANAQLQQVFRITRFDRMVASIAAHP